MDADTAKFALQFLDRVQLSGAEVPAFVAVRNALTQVIEDAGSAESEADR